jgi:hypothetical protein
MIWAGRITHVGEISTAYNNFVCKPEEKELFGKPESRKNYGVCWKSTETVPGDDWIELSGAESGVVLVNTIMTLQVT